MCSQGIAAPSHSWSLRSLFPRTGWSFDSNRKTQTNHPIPRMIGRSQVPGRNHHPKDPARSCSRMIHLEAKSVRMAKSEVRHQVVFSHSLNARSRSIASGETEVVSPAKHKRDNAEAIFS